MAHLYIVCTSCQSCQHQPGSARRRFCTSADSLRHSLASLVDRKRLRRMPQKAKGMHYKRCIDLFVMNVQMHVMNHRSLGHTRPESRDLISEGASQVQHATVGGDAVPFRARILDQPRLAWQHTHYATRLLNSSCTSLGLCSCCEPRACDHVRLACCTEQVPSAVSDQLGQEIVPDRLGRRHVWRRR